MTTSRRLAIGAVLALAVGPVAGCGSHGADAESRPMATVTATATATVTTSPVSGSPRSSGSPPRCRTSHLGFRLLPGEGAAGSTYYALRMTNTSTTLTCATRGFGGVSLVAAPGGKPIGAPADRINPQTAATVVLKPGQHADATLREVHADNYPSSTCHPTPASGLRVYPPDETHSAYVVHATTACKAADVHLLSLTPYAKSR